MAGSLCFFLYGLFFWYLWDSTVTRGPLSAGIFLVATLPLLLAETHFLPPSRSCHRHGTPCQAFPRSSGNFSPLYDRNLASHLPCSGEIRPLCRSEQSAFVRLRPRSALAKQQAVHAAIEEGCAPSATTTTSNGSSSVRFASSSMLFSSSLKQLLNCSSIFLSLRQICLHRSSASVGERRCLLATVVGAQRVCNSDSPYCRSNLSFSSLFLSLFPRGVQAPPHHCLATLQNPSLAYTPFLLTYYAASSSPHHDHDARSYVHTRHWHPYPGRASSQSFCPPRPPSRCTCPPAFSPEFCCRRRVRRVFRSPRCAHRSEAEPPTPLFSQCSMDFPGTGTPLAYPSGFLAARPRSGVARVSPCRRLALSSLCYSLPPSLSSSPHTPDLLEEASEQPHAFLSGGSALPPPFGGAEEKQNLGRAFPRSPAVELDSHQSCSVASTSRRKPRCQQPAGTSVEPFCAPAEVRLSSLASESLCSLRGISEIRSKALEELANLRSCFDLLLFLPCQYVALQTPAALPPEPSRTCDAGASESRTPEWTKSYAGPLAHRLAADGVDVHGAVEAETEPGAPRGREAPGARSVLPREEGAVDLMAGDNRAAWIHMSDAQPHKGRTADSSSKFQFSFVRAVPRQPSTEKASDTHPVKESRVGGVSSTPVAAASSSNAEPNTPSLRGGVAGVEREAASATEAPLGVDQRQKRKTQQHTALGEGTGGLEGGEQSATQEGSDAAGNGQVDVCNEKTPRKTPRGVMSLEDQQRELRRKLEIALARHLAAQEETEDAPRARFTERGRGQARRPKRAKDAVEEDAQNIVGRAREVAIVGCIEKIGHCRVRAATRGGRPMMISSATIRDVSPSPSGGHPKDAAGGGKDAARIHVTWFDKFVQVVKLKRRHVVCLIGKLVRGKTGRMKMHNPKFQFLAPSEDVFFASAAKDSVSPPDAGPDAEQESTGLLPPADDQTEDERATRSHSVTASMQTGCVSLQPHGCPAGTQNGSREAAVLSPSAEDAGRHSVQTAEAGTEPVHQRTDGVLKGTRSVTEEAPAHNETPSASPPVQKLMPIYPSVAGVPAKIIRAGIDTILRANRLAELVPEYLRRKRGLWTLDRIMRALHYPESSEDIQRAKRDLFYSTMLWLQLAKKMRTREVESQFRGYASRGGEDVLRAFYSSLTFPLTPSQMQAIEEIRGDMASDRPMRRLLQGDVGSGKTVVAAAALLLSAASGHQAALLAPTAALARQHQLSLEKFLGPLGFRVNLLVSDSPDKDATIRLINTGNAEITVGTHALLQNYVLFPRLGLLVVDEQHKFGVNQRWKLLVRRATGEPVAEDLSSSASSQGQKHPRVGSEGTKDECPKPRSSAADPGTVENGAGVRKTMPHGAALASEDVQGARKEAHVSKQGCGENADASADSSKEPKRLQARDCPPEAAGRTETGEGVEGGRIADVLLMTATPIPRTQVLLKYGDLKLSKLLASELRPWQSQHRPSEPEKERGRNLPNRDGEEKPDMLQTTPGSQTEYRRPQVETYLIDKRREAEVGEMMRIIRDEISKKRQVFWVCPLVDGVGVSKRKGMSEKGRRKGTPTPNPCGEATPESLALEFEAHQRGRTNEGELEGTNKDGERRGTCATKRGTQKEHNSKESAAVQRFEELARLLPDVRVRLLHGRMKPEEKEEALSDLREGRVDLLVATTVVEVGIDIPNASVIVIDGAERFGLTQLHQLRGRVGRDARCPSFCFVLIDPLNKNLDEKAMHRFAAMAATTDGFQLAETDAQLRGAGTLFGRQQHGQSDLWIVSGLKRKEHARILETATKDAEEIIGLLEDQTQNSRCSASLEGSAENDPAANRNWFAHSNKAETRDDPRVRNSFVDRAIYGGQLAGEPVLIELGTKTASFDGQLDQRSGMSFIQNVGVTCGYDGPPIDKPKEKQGTKGTSLQSSSVADSSACEEGKAGSPAKEKQTQTASGRNKTCKNVYIGSLDRCSAEGSETRNLKLSLTQEDIKAARELAEEVRVLIPPSKVDWLFRV